ncbi:MAG TPA: glycosyltransferase family 2 protein [Vicinamibacterales bacterium]|nr:glycosyltransferase family 2 protein [Vicinamibacterales bacterium]
MTPEVSAIIVNYNAGHELALALRSVRADCAQIAWEAVIVDNASSDGSAAVAETFPQAMLIRNATNVGFGRAVNQAVASSKAPLLLLLNPDCQLAVGATATMRAVLDSERACAIVGPRILDPDGAVQGSARGDPDMLTGLFGRTGALRGLMPFLAVARRNVVVEEAVRSGASSVVVDWLSGACLLVRRDAFLAAGGFDERFFMYWEDADLCRRLRGRGYTVRYVPAAMAVHKVGRSSQTAKRSSIRAFHESAYLYYSTHVAPGVLNPRRLLARALLGARCWWQLRASGS